MENFKLFPKQKQFIRTVVQNRIMFPLYGGGVSGGKTIVSFGYLDTLAQQYPKTRYAIFRKTMSSIKRNSVPSFSKILEMNGHPNRAQLHKGDWTYRYANGSELLFIEANKSIDPDFNKIRGLELTGAVMDEGNETDEDVFNILITRTGRWNNKKHNIRKFVMVTCNPDPGWVKSKWYDKWSQNKLEAPFYFQQSLPQDNPHNDKAFMESLEYLPEAEYERYVKGNWDYSMLPNQLIPFIYYKDCTVTKEQLIGRVPEYLGIDVAREGNDKTILCFGDSEGVLWFEEYDHDKCIKTAPIIKERLEEFSISPANVIIDANGNGAAMEEALNFLDIYPTLFKSQDRAQGLPRVHNHIFRNKRAEAFWIYRIDVMDRNITFPDHPKLKKQSLLIDYMMENSYIQIEGKKTIKKKLRESPDYFEAAVMMNYVRHGMGLDRVSLRDYNFRAAPTILVSQDINRQYKNDSLVSESIRSTYDSGTMAPSYLDSVPAMQY